MRGHAEGHFDCVTLAQEWVSRVGVECLLARDGSVEWALSAC